MKEFWKYIPVQRREKRVAETETMQGGYIILESCLNEDIKDIRAVLRRFSLSFDDEE